MMRTLPIQPRRDPPSQPGLRKLWERYLRANPDWEQGIGLFVWVRLDYFTLLRGLFGLGGRR